LRYRLPSTRERVYNANEKAYYKSLFPDQVTIEGSAAKGDKCHFKNYVTMWWALNRILRYY